MAISYDVTPAHQSTGAFNGLTREWKMINIDGISAASVAAGNADFDAELKSLSRVCTIEAVGVFTAGTTTAPNVIISGMDFSAGSGAGGYADSYSSNTITWLEYLNTLSQTGATITEVSF